MSIVALLTVLLIGLGILEHTVHRRRLRSIPIRIQVNGTRGKSTTARLIAAILREAGYKVIAKTTGTEAKLILEDGGEIPVPRRGKPSITEQIRVVARAARAGADALVVECMALNPELQWVTERKMVQSTIGVLTNVRVDHVEEMGSTRESVAAVLALAIPESSALVLGEMDFVQFFEEQAAKSGTTVYLADPASLPTDGLYFSPALMFADNVACALKVGELLGIPEEICWAGLAKAAPDRGSTRVFRLDHPGLQLYFVNALAANDPVSTLLVWESWQNLAETLSLGRLPLIGLWHNRVDRGFRLKEMADLARSRLNVDYLWLTGDLIPAAKRHLKRRGFDPGQMTSGFWVTPERIIADIAGRFTGRAVLFAYGNTKGFGLELASYFEKNGELIEHDSSGYGAGSCL